MQISTSILTRICFPQKFLAPKDVSPAGKQRLYEHFGKYGLPHSTCYLRIFDKGFKEWEIVGVDSIKDSFIKEHLAKISAAVDGDVDLCKLKGSEFYEYLRRAKLVSEFKRLMNRLGMSEGTTLKKFLKDDFEAWERKGVKSLIGEFAHEEV